MPYHYKSKEGEQGIVYAMQYLLAFEAVKSIIKEAWHYF